MRMTQQKHQVKIYIMNNDLPIWEKEDLILNYFSF